ncbi:MAG: MOSC domain-containing protein, partial [Undibacterium sp.]|nr:MOSC domain-containing protein [Opitutaceae bacterium]
RFLTQRTFPRMALIATALDATHLTLSASAAPMLQIARASDPTAPLRNVSVWKSENLLAEDCGGAVAIFLSNFLATPCRLVRIGPAFIRPLPPQKLPPSLGSHLSAPHSARIVTFADAYPLLIIGESTLADLNDRLVTRGSDALPMDRFRPNLVIAGAPAFAEDTWPRLRIGTATFRAGGPCARCIMTTTDQITGARDGPEPLRTLATYRRDLTDPTDVNFGQNLLHETKFGSLHVGDPVELLSSTAP